MGLVDAAGVASIMPFVAVLTDPNVVETNRYLAAIYNRLGFQTSNSFLIFLGLVSLLVVVGSTGFRALTLWTTLRYTSMRQHALSCRLFAAYLNRPYVWFLRRHSADLGKTILAEVGNVVGGAIMPTLQLASQLVILTFMVGMLLVVDVGLALIVSVVLGSAYGLISWRTRRYLTQLGEARVRANRERFRLSNEAFAAIKDIKIMGLEDALLRRFEKPSLRFVRNAADHQVVTQLPQYGLQAIAFSGILLIVQYQLLTSGSLSQSLPLIALYTFAGYRMLPAVQHLYASVSNLRFSASALNLLHQDLEESSEVQSGDRSSPVTSDLPLKKQLDLINVSYRYPGAPSLALRDVSISIPARSIVGFAGFTGAGKTTAVDVILGLCPPDAGQVLIDGIALTADNTRAWLRHVGYVPQHIFLADDSVAANIAFGVPGEAIDAKAVERAAKLANLHEFVTEEMELGYGSLIGERGIRLSGGQRQRIGIARALYHDPDVVIMDEATNALDNITERAVMEAVGSLGHRKTIILIAHRLTTVKKCDIIFLFERGQIVASGSYEKLMTNNGNFRRMASEA
jgi:ABC-type multidrug transport system fused ATPase/permease subunit